MPPAPEVVPINDQYRMVAYQTLEGLGDLATLALVERILPLEMRFHEHDPSAMSTEEYAKERAELFSNFRQNQNRIVIIAEDSSAGNAPVGLSRCSIMPAAPSLFPLVLSMLSVSTAGGAWRWLWELMRLTWRAAKAARACSRLQCRRSRRGYSVRISNSKVIAKTYISIYNKLALLTAEC